MAEPAHIRVVNDDPTQLHLAVHLLKRAGYRVTPYERAKPLLEDLAEGARTDLFVVDLHMPGIDGWKLCRLLRSSDYPAGHETPILIVSATFTGADVEAMTTDLGADAFLSVPHDDRELLDHVEALLEGRLPHRKPRALIVDDDPSLSALVRVAFEGDGFEVHLAGTLDEAAAMRRERRYAVVVLDYHLPDGTCEDILRDFRDPAQSTVAVVMTGDTDPALAARLLDLGADGYVRKPFEPSYLLELARRAQRERALLRVEGVLEQRTRELQASERRYASLFAAIPDLVVLLTPEGIVAEMNAAARELLEGPDGPSLGVFAERVHPEDRGTFDALLSEERTAPVAREVRVRSARGRWRELEMTSAPATHDRSPAVVVVARDLTVRRALERERHRLEEQLRHAQRLESLGVMAGGIAHDFNNLLVGILGNAGLALLETPLNPVVEESLEQIETAARRAAELTRQILTFAGKGSVEPRILDLSEVVSEMGKLLEPAISRKAEIQYSLAPGTPPVEADAGQLRQVVMNLIMNASDALEGGPGRIRVRTGEETLTADDLLKLFLGESAHPGRFGFVEVEDDGIGMDARTLRRMFEPFFSTKDTGKGLGLAAALGIVRAHAGVVRVRSEPGAGTLVRVLLPAASPLRKGHAAYDAESAETPAIPEPTTVLVVDDEQAVRDLASSALRRHGFPVVCTTDGEEALHALRKVEPAVGLVLLDIDMPRFDGIETLSEIRRAGHDVPVILSSGSPPDEAVAVFADDERIVFLQKPYGPRELLQAASLLLDDAGGGRRRVSRSRPAGGSPGPRAREP